MIEGADHRRVATKEDAGVVGFERSETAVGRAVWISRRRPREVLGVEACLLEPVLKALQPFSREGDVRLLVGETATLRSSRLRACRRPPPSQ